MTLFLLSILSTILSISSTEEWILTEQQQTEIAIISWADSTFAQHENYKFEDFKAHYTDDYFIQSMRLETYQDQIDGLKMQKEKGEYNGTPEQYTNAIKKLSDAIAEATVKINTIPKVSHYETLFWSNIKTRDGITVYYGLIIKLDPNFRVTEAVEQSSIGKKDESSLIAYKPEVTSIRVQEKTP